MLVTQKPARFVCYVLSATLLLLSSLMLAGCATGSPKNDYDPYHKVNQATYSFNDAVDNFVLKPIAKAYNFILPQPVRNSTRNFFVNLNSLPTVASDLLQGDVYYAFNDAWRFLVNSTVGVGGLFDVAKHIGLKPHKNDMGLTFAKWGWKNSTYVELPFLGPSTVRDALALPFDLVLFAPWQFIDNDKVRYSLEAWGIVDYRASLLTSESIMEKAALDPYVFRRNAYIQLRDAQIKEQAESTKTEMKDAKQFDGELTKEENNIYVAEQGVGLWLAPMA